MWAGCHHLDHFRPSLGQGAGLVDRQPVDAARELQCGCVGSVTRVLQAIKGVSKVEVSLTQAQARVEFDPALASREQLRSAIEDAGFDATL